MSVRRALALVGILVAHGGLLVAPSLALGQGGSLLAPRSLGVVSLLLLLSVLESQSFRGAPSSAQEARKSLALISALALLGVAWVSLTTATAMGSWLGAPLALAGVGLRVAAIRALGPSFTSGLTPVPCRPRVATGIYRAMRHPSDVGLLLLGSGLAVLGGSVLAVILVLFVLLPSVAVRLVREERALRGHFGPTDGITVS